VTHTLIYKSSIVQNLDYKIYDFSKEILTSMKDKNSSSNVVIVDIDEKSLASLGQWPWSRLILAKLIGEISSYRPSSISLDIIFPEKDRTSPEQISAFYKKYLGIDSNLSGVPKTLWDNDAVLASTLKNSNTTLSYYLSANPINNKNCEKVTQTQLPITGDSLISYPYLLCNTPKLLDSLSSFGYINIDVDDDGILRRYSLVQKYRQKVVPSLALATLLNIDKNFELLGSELKLERSATALLSFYKDEWYKKVSAIDLLHKNIDKSLLLGKIVIIGSSAIALHDQVIIAPARNIAGVQVHATAIDNLLRQEILTQPDSFKFINVLLSFLLSMVLFLLLVKKENTSILWLFVSTILMGVGVNFYLLQSGVYISVGYILIPFFIHFFLISILFIFIDTNDRKVFAQELNRSHIALVDSMAYVAEIHDFETGSHIMRTKKYIQTLGEHILSKGIYSQKVTTKMIEMMYATAPMHDIGKVGIPDSILKKKGKLTALEHEVMRNHPNLGKHIINNAIGAYKSNAFFVMAKNIAHYHHEKWDGTGYPEGLKGEEIPLEARFMAISDVYDALISKRVYKDAYSYETTVKIIKEGSGESFDPVLVDAFLEITDKFQIIAQTYSDREYNE